VSGGSLRRAGVNAAEIQAAAGEYPRGWAHGIESAPEAASAARQAPNEARPNSVHPPSTTAHAFPG